MNGRLFVWIGGALFVGALADCAWSYILTWSTAMRPGVFNGWPAVAIDAALFSVFALHHSVLARERVKAGIARVVSDPLLRSTYVWVASILLIGVCMLWQPTAYDFYRHTGLAAVAHAAVQLGGLSFIALSVRAIDPLELAGIHEAAACDPSLQIGGPYRWVRHPLYLGWMLAVFGAAHMTGDRLAFAVISSIYLVIAVPWEERSLEATFGERYKTYRKSVKWRIIPFVY